MWLKSWISIEFYRAMFSAVLWHLVCHWKRHSPWVWIFCLIRSWIKTQWNLFHWVPSCIYTTYIQQFCWLLDTWVINKFEKFIWKAETSKLNVFQLSTHTCIIFVCLTVASDLSLRSIKPSLHLENGVVVCYTDLSVNSWLSLTFFIFNSVWEL